MRNHLSISPLSGFCIYILLFFSLPTYAEKKPQNNLEEKIKSADFVFQGEVVRVAHRFSSQNSEDDPVLPYTFVTYRVDKTIKGKTSSEEVTLRFFGGPAGAGDIIMSPDQPLFDLGDKDVLMVEGNETYPCPLVGCVEGRFRFIDGSVLNELGQRFYIDSEGSLQEGEAVTSEDIRVHQLAEGMVLQIKGVSKSKGSE